MKSFKNQNNVKTAAANLTNLSLTALNRSTRFRSTQHLCASHACSEALKAQFDRLTIKRNRVNKPFTKACERNSIRNTVTIHLFLCVQLFPGVPISCVINARCMCLRTSL